MPGRPSIVRRSIHAATALALIALAAGPAHAQRSLDEYEVKAAFLYNFVKFVEWPPSDHRSDAVVIGIVGRGPFNEALEVIASGKKVGARVVRVRQLRREDDPRTFHIVFIPQSEARDTATIVQSVRDAGVFTVGETPSFLAEGGIARFYVEANRVRFQIDAVGAQRSGLKISSQLLSLAK